MVMFGACVPRHHHDTTTTNSNNDIAADTSIATPHNAVPAVPVSRRVGLFRTQQRNEFPLSGGSETMTMEKLTRRNYSRFTRRPRTTNPFPPRLERRIRFSCLYVGAKLLQKIIKRNTNNPIKTG